MLGYGCKCHDTVHHYVPTGAVGGAQPTGIDGQNVIGFTRSLDGNYHGWLYNGSTISTLLDPLGLQLTVPYCISGNQFGGYYADAHGVDHPFIFIGTSYLTLSSPVDYTFQTVTGIQGRSFVGYS